jgi:hypothetical protein
MSSNAKGAAREERCKKGERARRLQDKRGKRGRRGKRGKRQETIDIKGRREAGGPARHSIEYQQDDKGNQERRGANRTQPKHDTVRDNL